jgi:hypothetical protein
MRIFIGALFASVLVVTGCPGADAPEQADTVHLQGTPGVDTSPAVAPGDTAPRPPAGQPPPPGGTPPVAQPGARPPVTTPPVQTPPAQPAPTSGSVRGRLEVVGAAPRTQLVIRREGGDVQLHGDAATVRALRSVQGMEIEVSGHRQETLLHVERFAVRAVDGIPAVDGVLQRDGDMHVLVSADGTRHHVHHLPEPLRTRVGQRVWIAGPLDREAQAFGVIES